MWKIKFSFKQEHLIICPSPLVREVNCPLVPYGALPDYLRMCVNKDLLAHITTSFDINKKVKGQGSVQLDHDAISSVWRYDPHCDLIMWYSDLQLSKGSLGQYLLRSEQTWFCSHNSYKMTSQNWHTALSLWEDSMSTMAWTAAHFNPLLFREWAHWIDSQFCPMRKVYLANTNP